MVEIGIGRKFLAELIGTYGLVLFGAGSAAITLMLSQGWQKLPGTEFNIGIGYGGLSDWLSIGMAFGIIIACMVYVFGHISGAHMNPAITIALWAVGRFPGREVIPYIAAQLIGASLASVSFGAILGGRAATVGNLGATAPFYGVSYAQAIFSEAIATFFLMLVVMGLVADKRTYNQFAGLMIGLTVTVSIITTGNITGGSLNPARTFGPYLGNILFGGPNLWGFFPICVIGPIIGALIAAFMYDYISRLKDIK